MENLLRKRLTLIKNRAKQLGRSHRLRHPAVIGPQECSPIEPDGEPCTLAEAAAGTERTIGAERFYWVRLVGDAIAADAPEVARRFARMPRRTTWPLSSLVQDPGPDMARRIAAEEVCFLDIETTGLMPNTYVFLCGLMYVEGETFVVEHLLARDYSEEAGVLLCLRDVLSRYPMVITYNGAGFDVPFLQTRMAVARIDPVDPQQHVDLLEAARGRFGEVLPNCKLETIERHLRGTPRTGDIPGWEIPEAYHEFVRTGDARRLRRILYHNRMDLLAMAYLVNDLAG